MDRIDYLHLPAGTPPPASEDAGRYLAVVIIEQSVDDDWRNAISDWLVETGCRFMLAWGEDCSLWDDSVDWASLAQHDFQEIPDDQHVMTAWHEQDTLAEVFSYAVFCAEDPMADLPRALLLHIAAEPREADMLTLFQLARDMDSDD